ncbi:MAG: hypothetical protein AAF846_02790 [Chloroflexota bacterium]
MTVYRMIGLLFLLFIIVGCGSTAQEPTVAPSLTPFPSPQPQATRTPFTNSNLPTPTQLVIGGNQIAPTAIIPATVFVPPTATTLQTNIGGTSNSGFILTNGTGLTNGAPVTNGEFQVEGYCNRLNSSYGVSEDGTNWFCTFNGQNAIQLRQADFNEICQLTYNNPQAIALQINNGQRPAYQWRCYQPAILPTPTSSAPPQLLNNGRGMSTGTIMNNGEVEVEGYCSSINPTYGVAEDGNFWYCTSNGTRILTLGVAEFDDICIRTYNNPAAYAEQIQNNDRPAYRWRCFAIPA